MYLTKIMASKKEEIEKHKKVRSWTQLDTEINKSISLGKFRDAILAPGISIIAEIKRASPSKGLLAPDISVEEIACIYQDNGAAAISVLTEEKFFLGSIEDLQVAKNSTLLPLLRKDFIIDPYQILEAKWAGADAILLIMAALSINQAMELSACAHKFGLDVLLEVHEVKELENIEMINPDVIGINNRNLKNFNVTLDTTCQIVPYLNRDYPVISESGIQSREDINKLVTVGVDGFLIGESLITKKDPGKTLRELLANDRN